MAPPALPTNTTAVEQATATTAMEAPTATTAMEAPTATEAMAADTPTTGTSGGTGTLKVGLVTDVGRLNDKNFNQGSWEGVVQAKDELGVETKLHREPPTPRL